MWIIAQSQIYQQKSLLFLIFIIAAVQFSILVYVCNFIRVQKKE